MKLKVEKIKFEWAAALSPPFPRMRRTWEEQLLSKPFLTSFGVTTLLFATAFAFFTPYFYVNADTFKLFFAQGVGTGLSPSEYIGYSNIAIGWVLKNLYLFSPNLPWFGLYYLSTLFLGLWAFLAALLLRPKPLFAVLLFLISCFAIQGYYFCKPQYTILSSLAFQGAFFLLLSLYEKRDSQCLGNGFFLAGSCLFLSFTMRTSSFLLAALVSFPAGLHAFWNFRWSGKRHLFLSYFGAFLLAFTGLIALDHQANQADPGWREFNKFNRLRTALKDDRIPVFTPQTKPWFDAVGWTENDLEMFKSWCYMDPDIYSVEKMRKLCAVFPQGMLHKPGSDTFYDIFFTQNTSNTVFLCLLTFLLFLSLGPFRLLALNFAWVIAILIGIDYFLILPERIYLPTLSYLLGLSIFYTDPYEPLLSSRSSLFPFFRKSRVAFLVLALLFSISSSRQYFLENQFRCKVSWLLRDSLVRLKPNGRQLYVVWGSAFPYEDLPLLGDYESFRDFHILELAVFQRSPHSQRMMEHFGLKDLLTDMVGRPDVFLICGRTEGVYYARFMEEKYRMSIRARKVFSCPLFNVYNIQLLSGAHSPRKPAYLGSLRNETT